VRRIAAIVFVVGAAVLVAILAGVGDSQSGRHYTVELDNAFGMVEGGDVKVAGVPAGVITGMRLDKRTKHALVDIRIDQAGFGSLRRDVRCQTRPQSLLGEYFLDCVPGNSRRELHNGAVIPVGRTASTVPPDLITNVMRRPYRERLRIILGELGAGVAGNAGNLNAALRRAVPALRETDRVLSTLGDQNRVLGNLVSNADTVMVALAHNRRDVGRFVVKARDTAGAVADRRDALAAGLHRLPGFLRELRPTMASLGGVARNGLPALRNLNASAGGLERLLRDLGPFADANRPAIAELANASRTGRPAVRRARPVVKQLRSFAGGLPELSRNLALILAHLEGPQSIVQRDPRSPGGRGYTGVESILQYAFDQTLAINAFDGEAHLLKAGVFADQECSPYADAQAVKDHPNLIRDCASALGPNQPGVTGPDPTRPPGAPLRASSAPTATAPRVGRGRRPSRAGLRSGTAPRSGTTRPGAATPPASPPPPLLDVPLLRELLHGAPAVPRHTAPSQSESALLDYLLGQ
jgi:virulence factor Mce-like protein